MKPHIHLIDGRWFCRCYHHCGKGKSALAAFAMWQAKTVLGKGEAPC